MSTTFNSFWTLGSKKFKNVLVFWCAPFGFIFFIFVNEPGLGTWIDLESLWQLFHLELYETRFEPTTFCESSSLSTRSDFGPFNKKLSTLFRVTFQPCCMSEVRKADELGSISSTFYAKLLCPQIPNAPKDIDDLTDFFAFRILACKSCS